MTVFIVLLTVSTVIYLTGVLLGHLKGRRDKRAVELKIQECVALEHQAERQLHFAERNRLQNRVDSLEATLRTIQSQRQSAQITEGEWPSMRTMSIGSESPSRSGVVSVASRPFVELKTVKINIPEPEPTPTTSRFERILGED